MLLSGKVVVVGSLARENASKQKTKSIDRPAIASLLFLPCFYDPSLPFLFLAYRVVYLTSESEVFACVFLSGRCLCLGIIRMIPNFGKLNGKR
jgi:hypothetical protein